MRTASAKASRYVSPSGPDSEPRSSHLSVLPLVVGEEDLLQARPLVLHVHESVPGRQLDHLVGVFVEGEGDPFPTALQVPDTRERRKGLVIYVFCKRKDYVPEGFVYERLRRLDRGEPAATDDTHSVAYPFDLGKVVRGEEDR